MQEITRTIVLTIAAIVFAGTFLKLLASAFRRDMLWGVFSVFAPPIGVWLHALTTWWDNSRLFIVHIAAGVLTFCAFFLFPRAPMNGFWSDEETGLVVDIRADGTVRDYSLAPDCTYQLRPAHILTQDLPIKSPLRLRFTGSKKFDLGWYAPGEGTIKLYDYARDPSIVTNRDNPLHLLKRVAEPTAPAFVARLEALALREALADRALLFVQNYRTQPVGDLITEDSRARLQRYIALARSNTRPADATLSDQIYALHLRANYGTLLKQNASLETVLAALLKETDFLQLSILQRLALETVNVKPGDPKGSAVFSTESPNPQIGPRVVVLQAQKNKDGLWGFDLFQLRDDHIRRTLKGNLGMPISGAEEYLEYDAMTAGRNSLLR